MVPEVTKYYEFDDDSVAAYGYGAADGALGG